MKQLLFIFFIAVSLVANSAAPKRIISLAPSATKSIYLLGAKDLLVGCTSFCLLEKPEDAQIVASAVQVNLEKVITLKPDLVIASSLTSSETLKTFEKLGIETILFAYPKSFGEICSHLQQIAEKIGKKQTADQIIAEAKARLEVLKSRIPQTGKKPKVFMQIGANPLFTVVPNTFMQDFIDFSGGENIASDLKIGSITRESVIVRNPDVIFISDMGSVSKDEKLLWETYKSLNAVKNKKVFMMDQEKTCSPTPLLFVDALEEMIGLMYKKQ